MFKHLISLLCIKQLYLRFTLHIIVLDSGSRCTSGKVLGDSFVSLDIELLFLL